MDKSLGCLYLRRKLLAWLLLYVDAQALDGTVGARAPDAHRGVPGCRAMSSATALAALAVRATMVA